jgi:hypothetical protein
MRPRARTNGADQKHSALASTSTTTPPSITRTGVGWSHSTHRAEPTRGATSSGARQTGASHETLFLIWGALGLLCSLVIGVQL